MTQSPGGTGSDSSDDDQRGQSAEPGPELPTVTQWWSADSVAPPHPPTEVDAPHSPTEVDAPHPPTETGGFGPRTPDAPLRDQTGLALGRTVSAVGPTGIVRRGPGVPVTPPAGQSGLTAEQVWRTARPPGPSRRRPRLRRLPGSLTVILLAASGAVLYLRFHHAPFRVTGVGITRRRNRMRGGRDREDYHQWLGRNRLVSVAAPARPATAPPAQPVGDRRAARRVRDHRRRRRGPWQRVAGGHAAGPRP